MHVEACLGMLNLARPVLLSGVASVVQEIAVAPNSHKLDLSHSRLHSALDDEKMADFRYW